MSKYNPKEIESKWQEKWRESGLYKAEENSNKPKKYILDMFPYPSGAGLHVGHPRSYTATDILARYWRMKGYNVLHPMGWDAFGLPAENYAIKAGVHPAESTKDNIANFRRQIESLGLSYDWSKEINTSEPEYYRWTQWLFLFLYEKGLAYRKKAKVNWCESCQTVLANEQVENGRCERCKNEVKQKELPQWFFKITDYAEELLADLDKLDWPEPIKEMQRNWIGRSEGAEIDFKVKDSEEKIKIFTTRPDTLFGATYMVVAPEHEIVEKLADKIENKAEVENYLKQAASKNDLERTDLNKDKTGVEIEGVRAVNPVNGEEIPVWIADYVLASYGTGAIMAVPAHDERDFEFARKYNLEIKPVILPKRVDKINPPQEGKKRVRRRTVHAIVKNPQKGEFLCLKWKKHPWTTFIVGGVEEGEDVVEAARREVLEETGYKNLRLIKKTECPVWAEYFAAHKDENREAITTAVFFELEDEIKDEVGKEELDKHEISWEKIDKLPSDFTCAELDVWLSFIEEEERAYTGDGMLFNSNEFDDLESDEAKDKITAKVGGHKKVQYKLRDWLVSRQRYWGAPIPMVYDPEGKPHQIKKEHLPLLLPEDVDYKPKGTSPLGSSEKYKKLAEELYGEGWRFEIDTMDTFVCSSWYYLRYTDPKNEQELASRVKIDEWLPVDMYIGGAEHAVLHLLYARFITKALADGGIVGFREPFTALRNQGLILAADGRKMSKSLGNVVNPDEMVEKFGADAMRMYEMFMGPFAEAIPWNTDGMVGVYRFLERVWILFNEEFSTFIKDSEDEENEKKLEILINKTVKKVTEDIEAQKFNTVVSTLMIFVNEVRSKRIHVFDHKKEHLAYGKFLQLLAPFAPHLAEELWKVMGSHDKVSNEYGDKYEKSIFESDWPKYDESKIVAAEIDLVVQVNGKVRDNIKVSAEINEAEALEAALASERVQKFLDGAEIKKVIFVPGKLINLVV